MNGTAVPDLCSIDLGVTKEKPLPPAVPTADDHPGDLNQMATATDLGLARPFLGQRVEGECCSTGGRGLGKVQFFKSFKSSSEKVQVWSSLPNSTWGHWSADGASTKPEIFATLCDALDRFSTSSSTGHQVAGHSVEGRSPFLELLPCGLRRWISCDTEPSRGPFLRGLRDANTSMPGY